MPILTRERDPIHVALDVHKDSITAGVLQPRAAAPVLQRIGPDDDAVRRLLGKLGGPSSRIRVCYEAGPTGFGLARSLRAAGVQCEVIAPSLVPKPSGDKVKTDRRDAAELAMLFRAGLLTAVHLPPPSIEAVRDLARARADVKDDLQRSQRRLLAFCLRHGHIYRDGSHWTGKHEQWLAGQRFEQPAAQRTFEHYRALVAVRQGELAAICEDLRSWLEVEEVGRPAHRLAAYHAIGYLGALSIVAEVGGEWDRFGTARGFMAFTGLIPSERSSGRPRASDGYHQDRQQGAAHAADRVGLALPHPPGARRDAGRTPQSRGACDRRPGGHRAPPAVRTLPALSARGMNPNVITTAVARELAGFVWAEMTATD